MFRKSVCVRAVSIVAVATLLGGCATNAITLDRAGSMVSAGRDAADATSILMERTRAANRQVLIEIVALDPVCDVTGPAIMSGNPPAGSRFCRPGGLNKKLYPKDWEMQRITELDLKATVATIRGLAGYLDLVDGVVTREPLDLGADLAAVHSDLKAIKGAADAVAGRDLGIPSLKDDQSAAVSGVLELVSVLVDEKQRVDDLRKIETIEDRQLFDETLNRLRNANTDWTDSLQKQLSQRRTLLEDRLERLARAGEAKRRPVVAELLEVIELQEKMDQLRAALIDVTDKLRDTRLAYLTLLDNPKAELTKAERKKAAKLNHDRIMGALKSLTGLLKAF